ncbi:ABC transporter permease [Flavobacteriaceae bacterium]|jgi:ABC-2 type transport system permease protein|nr:ABC transporter permease [Flavobacteriaceae bacterium]MDA9849555.1 ABC transporter permease [Flavobacteriaceae bacterium]
MNHTRLIIAREYLTQVKNKKFIIITLSIPFLIVGLGLFISFLSNVNSDSIKNITVVDNSGIFENSLLSTDTVKFSFLENLDEEEAKMISQDKNDDALIFIPSVMDIKNIDYVELSKSIKLISEDSPSLTLISSIESKLEKILTDLNYTSSGLDLETIKESKIYINLVQVSFEGEESTKIDGILKMGFGFLLGMLLYMFVFIYGSMILRSVLEEKTSRIIEIIISSVKPTQLMMGKIVGTSLVAFTQIFIWTALTLVVSTLVSSIFGVSTSELNSLDVSDAQVNSGIQTFFSALFNLPLLNIFIAFVFFFISGLFLYGSLFAAVGAAVDSETDANQFMFPLSMPLIIGLYVGIFTVSEDPSGTIPTIFSHIPFTSPIVMMMRIPYGVPIYEQLISLSILVATFFAIVWFAAKIYRVGILMYGQKPSYKDLYKWLKY